MPAEPEGAEPEDDEEEEKTSPLDDPEYLREQYHEKGRTQADIGDEHGVTSSTVSHYMKKYDIETRGNAVTDERLDDPEWLREAYEGDAVAEGGATMQQIADELGCSDGTVMRRLHQIDDLEIRRSASESDDEEDDEAEAANEAEDDEE
jgi:transposase-like protein